MLPSTYDLQPVIHISNDDTGCATGWTETIAALQLAFAHGEDRHLTIECYPGVLVEPLLHKLRDEFPASMVFDVASAYKDPLTLQQQFAQTLGEDPVFGKFHPWNIAHYFDKGRLKKLREDIAQVEGSLVIVGTGAFYVASEIGVLVYAGVTRWELQRRQRAHKIGNLGFANLESSPALLYKNAFFLEWRVADNLRKMLYERTELFLDLDDPASPAAVPGTTLRSAVASTVKRPFRVVPFFDPGPWGGQWMRKHFGLPDGPANYAWCFDCVPEENSVTLEFGKRRFHLPALVLVHQHPEDLLGKLVHERFGAEFPIRFDLLDTMDGSNLSLQVHPLTQYIRDHFGMNYTQDESYYMLDSGDDAELYLGLRTGVSRDAMRRDLEAAQISGTPFAAELYVNVLPTKKHDHFSIPAGTLHCSGANNMVLEISATPYIFTFKLWDWGRLGLDGRPRPIHLQHGLSNVQWERDTTWVQQELLNQVETVQEGIGWREERTGLHALESIETRRTWFNVAVEHDTKGNLHVLNLVEGDAAIIESPENLFEAMEVHYAETFIVPANVGRYRIRPVSHNGKTLATIKAYVRQESSR